MLRFIFLKRRRQWAAMGRGLSLLLAALLVACSAEAPAPGQGKGAVITGHASALSGDFDRAAFGCCAAPETTAALEALVALGAALAADDEAASAAAASAMRAAVGDHAPLAALAGPADAVAAATDLAGRRAALLALTAAARGLPLEPGAEKGRYAWVYCPMKPGHWLQAGEPVANPYYGASMLRCGNFEPAPGAASAAPAPVR